MGGWLVGLNMRLSLCSSPGAVAEGLRRVWGSPQRPEGTWLGSEGKASRGNAAISWSRLPGSVPTGVSPRLVPIWRPLLGFGLETSTPELQRCGATSNWASPVQHQWAR